MIKDKQEKTLNSFYDKIIKMGNALPGLIII